MEPLENGVDTIISNFVSVFEKDSDYEAGGIRYCGICKEPKTEWLEYDEKKILIPRACKCRREQLEKERQELERAKKIERIQYLRNRSMMDTVFANTTFKNFEVRADNEKQYKMCLKYVKHFQEMYKNNQGLLFYGQVGTGKSFAAGCIANALLDNLHSVIMTSFVKILQQLTGYKLGDRKDNENALINDLMQPELLIIDDLGAERSTDYAVEKVYNIIDSRCRKCRPMILTTNLTITEMKKCDDIRYARIYDRVFEMCYPIQFEGVSRRKLEAKKRFEAMKKFFEGDD